MRLGTLRSLAVPIPVVSFAFAALLWLARFSPPRAPTGIELDQSWQQAYPYFHTRGLQAGIDYVFTYGPLGFLETGAFTPELFWMRVGAWEIAFELGIAVLFALAARRIPSRFDRALFMFASLLAAVASDTYSESYRMLAISIVGVSLLGDRRASLGRLLFGSLVLAVLSLVKFPYLVLSALAVGSAALARSLRPPRARGLAPIAAFGSLLAALWLAAGQRLAEFPSYLSTSLELASGFSQGMYVPADLYALVLALSMLALVALLLALRIFTPPRSAEAALACAFLALATLLAWKSSFVLFDNDGAFASFSAAVTFLIPWPAARAGASPWISPLAAVLRCTCLAIGLFGAPSVVAGEASLPTHELSRVTLRWRDALGALGDLRAFEASQRALTEKLATRFDLPRTRAIVGEEPVDVFGAHQGVALLNGLDYRPRPVFQSYAAYTPELMELNRHFVASDAAPQFILSRLGGMPWRLPALEDASALQLLLRNFQPLLSEGGFVLWKRIDRGGDPAPVAHDSAVDRTLALGEWIQLEEGGAGGLLASIEAEPTWLGRLCALAYQPGELVLEIVTSLGDTRAFRIGLEAARAPFVLDPLLVDDWDLVRWLAGIRAPRPRALRVLARGGNAGLFQSPLRLRIERAPEIRPRRPPGAPQDFAFYMFSSHPTQAVVAPYARSGSSGDDEVLLVGAPSELRFPLEPGDHVLEASFGILMDDAAGYDGASFSAVLEDGERVLFERTLEPLASRADLELQSLRVEFHVDHATQLSLRTGPAGPIDVDLAYWREIAIDAPGAAERAPQVRMR